MTTIIRVGVKCPSCKAKFEIDVLGSTNFFGMTTELRRLTGGSSPWDYMVHTCQECGFTGGHDEFEGKVNKAVAAKIAEQIKPHIRDEYLSTDTRWEFAAMIAEWRGQEPTSVAEMYRNAAWCSNGSGREFYFRRRAADWLERALEKPHPDRPVIIYLIGELYRRCGEDGAAATWFDKAIGEAEKMNMADLKQLAIQQKTNPQEMISR